MSRLRRRAAPFLPLLVALACASTHGGEVEPPEVFVADLAPLGGGLFEQRVRIDLRVRNPNGFDLEAEGIDVQLDINGERFARALGNEAFTVPRLGEAVVPLEASTTLVGLMHQVLRMSERRELAYSLRGKIHLGGLRTVSFERTAELTP